jgi:hypothetical protein
LATPTGARLRRACFAGERRNALRLLRPTIGLPMGSVDIGDVSESSELGDLFQIKPEKPRVGGVQLAAGGYPVDLLEERELGGHAIEGHVTSRQSVVNAVRGGIDYARRNGDSTDDMRESSFTSLEAANKLVNVTISEHPDQVNRVVSGLSPKETLHSEFKSPTGFEAYAKNETSHIILSDTYAVRVVIVPDGRVTNQPQALKPCQENLNCTSIACSMGYRCRCRTVRRKITSQPPPWHLN